MNRSVERIKDAAITLFTVVYKSTDGLTGESSNNVLWYFDSNNTAKVKNSYSKSLPSLLFRLREQKIAEVAWSLSSFGHYASLHMSLCKSISTAAVQFYLCLT